MPTAATESAIWEKRRRRHGLSFGLDFSMIKGSVIPPEVKGLDKQNFLGKMHEEILNEDKQIH